MAKIRSQYVCQSCGYTTVKWLGRCTECSEYGTLIEEILASSKPAGSLSTTASPTPIN